MTGIKSVKHKTSNLLINSKMYEPICLDQITKTNPTIESRILCDGLVRIIFHRHSKYLMSEFWKVIHNDGPELR